jgi:hypothetical protein
MMKVKINGRMYKSIVAGEWLICSSDHLTDFATFDGDIDPHQPPGDPFNRNLLWLLMLLF